MPLVTNDEFSPNGLTTASPVPIIPPQIETVRVSTDEYKTATVDTKWVSKDSILTHISGSSWVVDYYSQILDTDSNLSGQQYTKNPVYQSYKKIINLEIKVQSALSTDQDDVSKEMNVTGTAILYPSIIPNEGDMFVADIRQGKLAVFRITSSRKNSIFKEACYEISYTLDTDDISKISDLNQKTSVSYYFHKDFLTYGNSPLIIKNKMDTLLNLQKAYDTMLYQYFKRFYSHEFKTLLVPSQQKPTYDHYLVSFILSMFDTREVHELAYIRVMNLDEDRVSRCDSLWEAIKKRDISLLNTAFNRVGILSTLSFSRAPTYNGIRYSGIGSVVYPKNPFLTVDNNYVNNVKQTQGDLQPSTDAAIANNVLINAFNLREIETELGDNLHPVTLDDFYVLSSNFYNNTTNQSSLEHAVRLYINRSNVDPLQLYNTAKNFHRWGNLEQFYYVPIVMTLIRSILKGM